MFKANELMHTLDEEVYFEVGWGSPDCENHSTI